MTRFHGCLSWSYDATVALGHEFAGAGLGYQWLPRSQVAGRFWPTDQAVHRPVPAVSQAHSPGPFTSTSACRTKRRRFGQR